MRETLKEGLRDYLNKPSLRLLVFVIVSTNYVRAKRDGASIGIGAERCSLTDIAPSEPNLPCATSQNAHAYYSIAGVDHTPLRPADAGVG